MLGKEFSRLLISTSSDSGLCIFVTMRQGKKTSNENELGCKKENLNLNR
jgi:hypothetical protein